MNSKKIVAMFLIISLIFTGIIGCSKSPETPGDDDGSKVVDGDKNNDSKGKDEDGKKDDDGKKDGGDSKFAVTKPITIEWWHALEQQYTDLVEDIVKQFHETGTEVELEAIYQGSYSDLNEKLIAAHAANNAPALSVSNTPHVAEYGASGICEDLTPYIEEDNFDIDDFGIGLIESTSYEGKSVTLPFLISTQVIYYNKDMADAEGIKLPETWDEMDDFLTAATKIENGETVRYGSVVPGWDQWYFETYYLNSGVEIVTDDNKTDLDSAEAVKIANQFKKWYQEGKINWAYGTDASTDMRQGFFDGKNFSVMHTSSLYNMYVDNCDFEVGMAYYPGAKTRKSEVGGSVLLIPSRNEQEVKNAAWEALKFLTSKEVNMQWAEGSGYMPTRKSVLETDEGKDFLKRKPAFQAIFDNLDNINPRIQHPAYSTLARIWKDSMGKAILEDEDMTKTMEDAAKLINDALADE